MNVGDKAPEILGTDQDGKEIKLSDYKGQKIVLYFYPKDSTSGCTAQACNLRDNYKELRDKGYVIIGASIQDEKSHKKFIEKNKLPFPLIADTDLNSLRNSVFMVKRKCMGAPTWVHSALLSSSTKMVSLSASSVQSKLRLRITLLKSLLKTKSCNVKHSYRKSITRS